MRRDCLVFHGCAGIDVQKVSVSRGAPAALHAMYDTVHSVYNPAIRTLFLTVAYVLYVEQWMI